MRRFGDKKANFLW